SHKAGVARDAKKAEIAGTEHHDMRPASPSAPREARRVALASEAGAAAAGGGRKGAAVAGADSGALNPGGADGGVKTVPTALTPRQPVAYAAVQVVATAAAIASVAAARAVLHERAPLAPPAASNIAKTLEPRAGAGASGGGNDGGTCDDGKDGMLHPATDDFAEELREAEPVAAVAWPKFPVVPGKKAVQGIPWRSRKFLAPGATTDDAPAPWGSGGGGGGSG
ncbi:unnamed protein product, partial [Phaeothamnion confervicola]